MDAPAPRARIDRALDRLARLHPKLIDLSLDRLYRLLGQLGNPHLDLPPVLHVAGTNGKGSVVATARAIAEAAGLRVHAYTSPHLVHFNERIRLGGRLIDDDALADLLDECEAANGDAPITFFEVTTAAAFLAFSREPADLCLLETGLGGRLDATNVVPDSAATAITPVSFDHQEFLGETLEAIAGEKAGILKPGVPCIVGPQDKDALAVIRERARMVGAPLFVYGHDWMATAEVDDKGSRRLSYRDSLAKLGLPEPGLPGSHQVMNAGTAVALMRHQRAVRIPEAALRAGVDWVRWPARLQNLAGGSLAKLLPTGSQLWLDGGHNPAAGSILRDHFKDLSGSDQSLILVCGMMANKDHANFLRPLAGVADRLIAVPIPDQDKAALPADLAATASDVGLQATVAGSVESALSRVATLVPEGRQATVLVAGSLYLAGHVLHLNGTPPD